MFGLVWTVRPVRQSIMFGLYGIFTRCELFRLFLGCSLEMFAKKELFGLFGVQSRSTVRKKRTFWNISNSGLAHTNCSEFGYDQTKNLVRNTDRKFQLSWSTFYRVHHIRPDRLNNGACWLNNIRKWPNHFWLNHIPFKLR